jgi:hypothetical protein
VLSVFGEVAAYPDASNPELLNIDPAWISSHLVTRSVPLLGSETRNAALFPALIGAMEQLQQQGLGDLVKSNAGCYNPKALAATSTAPASVHAYGAAIDINAPENIRRGSSLPSDLLDLDGSDVGSSGRDSHPDVGRPRALMIVVTSEQEPDVERRADDGGVPVIEEDANRAFAIQTEGAGAR